MSATDHILAAPAIPPEASAHVRQGNMADGRPNAPFKVALVHDWLCAMRGGEKCLEVACGRFRNAELFTLFHVLGTTSPTIDQMRIHTSRLQRLPDVSRYYRYLLPLMPRAIEGLRMPHDVDLVLSFSHAVAKAVRPPAGVPHVCYCFTPMRYAWEMRGEYFGDHANGRARAIRCLNSPIGMARDAVLDRLQEWDRVTSDRVTHFVACSQTVARRIAECYGRSSVVIHPPVDTRFYTPAEVRRDDYYLCVSALVPYKRIDLAVEACRRLGRRLVVIGTGPLERRLREPASNVATFLGWRTNREIREHLRRCRALLFPAHEDFGIVPVEANSCGAPVVALGRGGATETILPADENQIGTGVFFTEPTVDRLCEAIRWLEANLDRLNPQLARRRALCFRQERFERRLVAYVEQVACLSAQAR